jgi:hypothetical protein
MPSNFKTRKATKFPIENKVWAAIVGSGAGAVLSDVVIWAIGVAISPATIAAADAEAASASVASPLVNVIRFLLIVGPTAYAGYAAKHTSRTPPEQPQPGEPTLSHTPELSEADEAVQAGHAGVISNKGTNPDDLDGDGHHDTTGRFVPKQQ